MAIPGGILGAGRCRREQDARQREHANHNATRMPRRCVTRCRMAPSPRHSREPAAPAPAPYRVTPPRQALVVPGTSPLAAGPGRVRPLRRSRISPGSAALRVPSAFRDVWPCPPSTGGTGPTGTATSLGGHGWPACRRGPSMLAAWRSRFVEDLLRLSGSFGFFDTGARSRGCRLLGRSRGPPGTAMTSELAPISAGFRVPSVVRRRAPAGAEAARGAARFGSTWQRSVNHGGLTLCSMGPCDRGNPCRRSQAGTGAGGGAGGRAGIASGIGSRAGSGRWHASGGVGGMAAEAPGRGIGATSIGGRRSCAPPASHAASAPAEGIVAPAECDTPTDFRDTRRIFAPSCVMMRQHEPVPSGLRVHRAAHASARSGPADEGWPQVAGTTARARRDEAEHNRPHFS